MVGEGFEGGIGKIMIKEWYRNEKMYKIEKFEYN